MATETPSKHSTMPHATKKGVPAFLQSLYHIVGDEDTNNLIYWSPDGDSFFVQEPDRFAREELGRWFKHKNYQSFVRQLNNYGFYKIPHLQQGTLRSNGTNEYCHYSHPEFRRDRQDLLGRIQRKSQSTLNDSVVRDLPHATSIKKEGSAVVEMVPACNFPQDQLLETIMLDVGALKGRQTELEADNRNLRNEMKAVQVAMRQQQELIFRLLACFGVVPTTGQHHWTRAIQGVENQKLVTVTEINEETNHSIGSTDRCLNGDDIVISSPPCSPSPSVSLPSSSPEGRNQSPACSDSVDNTASPLDRLDSTGYGLSNQAPNFSEDLTSNTLLPFESLHSFPETNESFDFDADNNWEFVDLSAESVSGLNQHFGMAEICTDPFNNFLSSDTGSCNGFTTASAPSLKLDDTSFMPTTPGISGASSAPGNTTHTNVSALRRKRKASLVDESQRAGPECAPHPPPSPLSPYGTPTSADFILPTSLHPPGNDQVIETTIQSTCPWSPSDNFVLDTSATLFPSSVEGNRSPKRARR
ncbi:hypothetical protein AGABI2DRAFT_190136 [Agaricus bisporus var. bisporus H97]|uniref:hypothetical protein n=1 Tax=Agaricus bisporus var. bisporus (strain H97 / ATCC MYA-4626 / FGSC 10389) TaxID=936046 RepID=UPI00029F7E3C|nr:hypothetical protein AGABI2DRAFT_190136 [Agaricus bisporus var. bisporus H97]EKV50774.1 hypothetical protein AGABI2DRAFT_190136 [Agaricus bisporus var. bisporus H97]